MHILKLTKRDGNFVYIVADRVFCIEPHIDGKTTFIDGAYRMEVTETVEQIINMFPDHLVSSVKV